MQQIKPGPKSASKPTKVPTGSGIRRLTKARPSYETVRRSNKVDAAVKQTRNVVESATDKVIGKSRPESGPLGVLVSNARIMRENAEGVTRDLASNELERSIRAARRGKPTKPGRLSVEAEAKLKTQASKVQEVAGDAADAVGWRAGKVGKN